MKKKTTIWICQMILTGLLFILFSNCKKDTTPLKTEQIPVLTTSVLSDISQTSAKSGGNITNDGGATVTSRGICWSTGQTPTISDNKTTDGTGAGSFTSAITGLTPNTTYNLRAYATNNTGTGYGSIVSFTTLSGIVLVPQVKISSISPFMAGFDTEVTIQGSNFSSILSENSVTINNAVCDVTFADTNQLKIIVPKGCGTGVLTVTVKDKKVTGPIFTYLLTPVTTTLAGNSLGYLDGQGTNALLNNPVLLISISDGSIVFSDNGNGLIRNLEENGAVTTLQNKKKYTDISGMAVANNKLFVNAIEPLNKFGTIYYINVMFADGIEASLLSSFEYYGMSKFATGNDGYLYGTGTYIDQINGDPKTGFTRFNYTTYETTPYLKYTGIFDGYISVAGANNIFDIQIDNTKDEMYFLDSDPINRRLLIRKISNFSKSSAAVTTLYDLYSYIRSASTSAITTTGDLTKDPYINFYDIGNFYVENENKIYVASSGVIRKIEGNIVSIVGGDYSKDSIDALLGFSDGKSTSSRFNGIADMIQDAKKNLIISDSQNNRIRKISFE
jgi:hypothetical protein